MKAHELQFNWYLIALQIPHKQQSSYNAWITVHELIEFVHQVICHPLQLLLVTMLPVIAIRHARHVMHTPCQGTPKNLHSMQLQAELGQQHTVRTG